MNAETKMEMEKRHLAKFREISEVLQQDLIFWRQPGNEAYSAEMIAQTKKSLELNTSLIEIAERKIQQLL